MTKVFKIFGFSLAGVVILLLGLVLFGVIDLKFAKWEDTNKYHVSKKDNAISTIRATLAKEQFDLIDFTKKYTLLNFWEPGCKGCIMEMPILNTISTKHKDSINIYSFTQSDDQAINSYLTKREFSINYKNIGGVVGLRTKMKKLSVQYGQPVDTLIDFIPFSVLIDKEGKIIKVFSVISSDEIF